MVDPLTQVVTVTVKFCAGNCEEPLGEVEVPFPVKLGPVHQGADANGTAFVHVLPDMDSFRDRLQRALDAFSRVFAG